MLLRVRALLAAVVSAAHDQSNVMRSLTNLQSFVSDSGLEDVSLRLWQYLLEDLLYQMKGDSRHVLFAQRLQPLICLLELLQEDLDSALDAERSPEVQQF